MEKKKVLIVSYYWPPGGGGGVMRWLKFSKYLFNEPDWEPIIYTPENAGYLIWDESLEKEIPEGLEVLKLPILEPNNFLKTLGLSKFKSKIAAGGVGKKKENNSLIERSLIWIRSNLFIPDPRVFWVKPSVRFLKKELKNRKIDAIITTGPPHSMHLIGLELKRAVGIPWIADFRDPWTFIDFFEDLSLSKWATRRHFRLEREVLENADKLVTVSPWCAEEFERRTTKIKFEVIYNGYDPEEFKKVPVECLDTDLTIVHVGSLNKDRNAEVFWEAIAELCSENSEFKKSLKIRLIGSVAPEVFSKINELSLNEQVLIEKHLPHHSIIELIQKAQLLLLLINNTSTASGILPGKFYEYLGANRPIMCIGGSDSDIAKLIDKTKAGKIVEFDKKEEMKRELLAFYEVYKSKGYIPSTTREIENYSRRFESKQFASLLDEIIK